MAKTKWTKEEIKEYNKTHNFEHYPQYQGWRHTDRHCPLCDLNCPVSNKYPDRRSPKDKTKNALMDWDKPHMFHENVCPAVLTSQEIEANHVRLAYNDYHYFEELKAYQKPYIEKGVKAPALTSDEIIARIRANGIHFYGWEEFYDEYNRMEPDQSKSTPIIGVDGTPFSELSSRQNIKRVDQFIAIKESDVKAMIDTMDDFACTFNLIMFKVAQTLKPQLDTIIEYRNKLATKLPKEVAESNE